MTDLTKTAVTTPSRAGFVPFRINLPTVVAPVPAGFFGFSGPVGGYAGVRVGMGGAMRIRSWRGTGNLPVRRTTSLPALTAAAVAGTAPVTAIAVASNKRHLVKTQLCKGSSPWRFPV